MLVLKKNKVVFFFIYFHVYKSSRKKISESFEKPVSYYGQTKLWAENYIIKNLSQQI